MNFNKKALLRLVETYSALGPAANKVGSAVERRAIVQKCSQLLQEVPDLRHSTLPRCFAKIALPDVLRRRDKPTFQTTPFLIEDVNRIAESHSLMLRAEFLAIEFIKALKPWGAVQPDRIVWHFVEKPFLHVAYLGRPFDFASDTLWESLDNQGYESINNGDSKEPTRFEVPLKSIPCLVKQAVQADAGWTFAVDLGLSISGPKYAIQPRDWCRFADLVNPFALLISLWQTRCFVFDITNEEDRALRLYVRR